MIQHFHKAVVTDRDTRLIECLAAELNDADGQEKRIAVVYGAMHMRAAVRTMTTRGFRCVEASWRTAIGV